MSNKNKDGKLNNKKKNPKSRNKFNKVEATIKPRDTRTIKRKIGDLGETLACKYLEQKGFSVIERNYLKKYGEIRYCGL